MATPQAHTPGPWHIKPGDTPGFKTLSGGFGIYAPARDTDDFFILQIAAMETNLKGREIVANARLISAAPELLVVARVFASHYPVGLNPFLDAAYKEARYAIAKALGEQA